MRAHRIRSAMIALLAAAVLTGGLVGASASGFPFGSTTVYGFNDPSEQPVPPKITCDDFAGNSNMNGRAVSTAGNCGSYTWGVNTGTWQTRAGEARPSGANATVTIPVGGTNATVEATLTRVGGAGDLCGVVLAHNGSAATPRYLSVLLVGTSSVQVRTMNGTTSTTIATATVAVPATATLRATLNSGVVRAWVNNSLVLTYTLTGAQSSLISAGTEAGLYDNNGSGRFSDMILSQAWP